MKSKGVRTERVDCMTVQCGLRYEVSEMKC